MYLTFSCTSRVEGCGRAEQLPDVALCNCEAEWYGQRAQASAKPLSGRIKLQEDLMKSFYFRVIYRNKRLRLEKFEQISQFGNFPLELKAG